MFSCDTMVVSASHSRYQANILAKNSDRPTGEPQPHCFYEGKEYPDGESLASDITNYLVYEVLGL